MRQLQFLKSLTFAIQ